MNETIDPSPRLVFVASDNAYRAVESDKKRMPLLLDPMSMVIPFSALPDTTEVSQNNRVVQVREHMKELGLLTPGRLWIRNPYDGNYSSSENALQDFVKSKYSCFTSVAARLGASYVQLVNVEVEQEKADIFSKFKAAISRGTANGTTAQSVQSRLEQSITTHTELTGHTPNVRAARAFATERNLSTDPDVLALIDLCESGNTPKSHKIQINGLRESTSTFKTGLDLLLKLGPKLGIDGDFSMVVERISSVEVAMEVRWPAS